MFESKSTLRLAYALITIALAALPDAAHATCGSASCFIYTGTDGGLTRPKAFTVDLTYQYVTQSRKLDGSREVGEVLTPKINFEEGIIEPGHHREIRTINTLVRVDLAYGVTPSWTFNASLPVINDKAHEHYDDVGTPDEHFTKSDGTSGFGDVKIGTRYAFLSKSRDLLVGGLDLKLPTGQYKLNDGEGAINEPTIQPGTGSYDGIASVHWSHQWIAHELDTFVNGSWRANGEHDLRYTLGDEGILGAGVEWAPTGRVTASLQVSARRSSRDVFRGIGVPSTGSRIVSVSPGVRFEPANGTAFYAYFQWPVAERVNESQLAPGGGLVLGLSKRF
jgi:hypothetical protein